MSYCIYLRKSRADKELCSEEEVLKRLEACHEKSKDAYAAQCLDHLIKSTRANVVMLHRMLKKKQEHHLNNIEIASYLKKGFLGPF